MSPAEVIKRFEADGWARRKGKGDHLNFNKPGHRFVVAIDPGVREIPTGTLRNIFRATSWKW